MPAYTIEAPNGVKFDISGDSPPTEQEINDIFSKLPAAPKPSPIAEQEAAKQQFIQSGTQSPLNQALSALGAPVKAGTGLATGLLDIALKGVQGVGSIYGKAAGQATLGDMLKSYYGDVAQTAQEIVPRAAFDLGQGTVAGFQSPETATQTLRSLNTISNPIAAALQALVSPQAAPTQARAQQVFEEDILNQALAQQGQQGVLEFAQQQAGLPSLGTANIDVARAAPLLIGIPEGAVGGAVSGLARGATALGRSVASPLQTARSVLGAVAPKVAARTAPATVEQSAMAALDITKEEVARHVPVVNQRVLEIQKAPKTASEALKAANTAEASLYQDALVADKAAEAQGLVPRSDLIMQRVEDTLNNIPTLTAEERLALIQDARARYTDVSTPAKGRALQQRLNKEFEAQFANDTFDRAAPANEVKLAVRNSIAEQMDEINKAVTGIDATPYSDIGSLIEFKGNLGKQIQRIEGAEARSKTGLASSKPSKLPTSKTEVALQIKRSALSPLQKTQLEKLDQNVSRLFTEGEGTGQAAALDPTVQQGLISKYGPQPTPPPLPVAPTPITPTTPTAPAAIPQAAAPIPAGTPAPALTLEQQIQQVIQTYPPKLRRDPALARLAAQAQLEEVSAASNPLEVALQEAAAPRRVAPAPVETVPVKTYPPEIQTQLDDMAREASEYRKRVNSSPNFSREEKSRRIKGFGMRQAAEKRQLTGELTGIEAARKTAREAGNYIGKPVQVNMGGQLVEAEVIGNPFGRVKIRLGDGMELTVLPENIGSLP